MFLPVDRSYLLADLRRGVIEVRFFKADGELRIMRATHHNSYVPPEYLVEGKVIDTEPGSKNLRVWDIDAKGWRTISLDRIVSIQIPNSI